jgi:hypothetical protein
MPSEREELKNDSICGNGKYRRGRISQSHGFNVVLPVRAPVNLAIYMEGTWNSHWFWKIDQDRQVS